MKNNFFGKSYLSVDRLRKEDVYYLFEKADEMKKLVETKGGNDDLKGKVMAALFYEPSSRTFTSFLSAIQRLGGGIIPMHGMSNSSTTKGETLEDTIRTFSCFADAIVMRHPEPGSVETASKYSLVPVINAGDGVGEHPTQALQDAYTIQNHFQTFEKLRVGMIGDLKNGRTVHSLSKLLSKLGVANIVWVSPGELKMPADLYAKVKNNKTDITETEKLTDVIDSLDVIYVTRVQKERFSMESDYLRHKLAYIITPHLLNTAKKDMIVMHPLPRVGEIATEVDRDPRAVYLAEQMRNGLYIRMALLNAILTK